MRWHEDRSGTQLCYATLQLDGDEEDLSRSALNRYCGQLQCEACGDNHADRNRSRTAPLLIMGEMLLPVVRQQRTDLAEQD
mmetsp:Transcript_15099/g.23243  ORF Transcript_15099/g.23243 Transcript_15099/m.23243 type:complete len:81 (+) Transcript_15099:58-300(+)